MHYLNLLKEGLLKDSVLSCLWKLRSPLQKDLGPVFSSVENV